MGRDLIEQVLKTTRNYSMLRQGDAVMAAVSGGPDSVFMLHALVRLKRKLRLKSISVCNLDHGLRGKESEKDSLFVKTEAAGLGLRFLHKRIDLARAGRNGLSTEELARQERYKFFRQAAARSGANVVATGHTLDDQAETILMRFVKGSSLKGMAGIAPVREEEGFKVIRPLVEIEKSEIARYLDGAGIGYVIDSTNESGLYFRNVVRREIMPFLERYNPRLKRSLFSLSEHLREDFEFIKQEKERFSRKVKGSGGGSVEVDLKDIVVQPRAIQKEVLRDCLDKCGGEVKKLSFRHWKEVEQLVRGKGKGACIDLPGSVRVARTEKALIFNKI